MCDLVSVANAFMLTDGPRCLGRLGRAAVRCKEDLAGLRARNDVRTNRGYVIDVYVASNRLPMLKNRKLTWLWKSVRCN